MPTANEIRRQFLDFFASKGHTIVPSASLIPQNDPTLIFTNAGMNQFKDVFLGTGTRPYARAVDSQKCLRVSGKHNDLDEVGRDTYHHTFFEMLGNWSFGDYYKREAISWAWELLTGVWGLPKDKLYATVYKTDDEAAGLWADVTDIDPSHILRFGEKDNFWEMGETGPCGPCSEIHIDLGEGRCDKAGVPGHECSVNMGCARYIELWNLVFIQYNRNADGSLSDLPAKHVDTGMGFERIVSVLQGKRSNYDIDVFEQLIHAIERETSLSYCGPENVVAMRAIADHLRTLTFAVADGALPGNEGRGYVLRRILRRAARFGRKLGKTEPFIYRLVPDLVEAMGDAYPEIAARAEHCASVIRAEEEGFGRTLDKGIELFDGITAELKAKGSRTISGRDAFKLYDTFGFPLDLTQQMAEERGFEVDNTGFDREMAEQRERARSAGKFTREDAEVAWTQISEGDGSRFTGYGSLTARSKVLQWGEAPDHYRLVVLETPFYAEMGGQVGDTGLVRVNGQELPVVDTRKDGSRIVHIVSRTAEVVPVGECELTVDSSRRARIASHHTATHLLHAALRQVLGSHVNQAGSLVAPDRLRFDFNHFEKVTPSQLEQVETLVNAHIQAALPVETREMSYAEAVAEGATALFGEKYGDSVRTVRVKDFSYELCGGTHVSNTSEILYFRVLSESSVATGVRRIEALAGPAAIEAAEADRRLVAGLGEQLKAEPGIMLDRVSALQAEVSRLSRESRQTAQTQAGNRMTELFSTAKTMGGAQVLVARIDGLTADLMREAVDRFKSQFQNGVIVLGGLVDDKPFFVAGVTKELTGKVQAGAIIKEVATVAGGGGGGRPDMAQAGGKDPARTDDALAKAEAIIGEKLR